MSFELKFTNFDFDKNLSQSGLNAGPLFDAAPPEPVGPTLYIGIGGSGKDVLLRLREKLFVRHEQEYKNQMKFPLEFLYYDFDPNWAKNDERRIYEEPYFKANVGFRHDEIFYASNEIKSVLADIDSPRQAHIREWFLSAFSGSTPGSDRQRHYSRLVFFNQYNGIRRAIETKLKNLSSCIVKPPSGIVKLNVVMVFTVASATGSGAFLDMAFLCRDLMGEIFPTHDFIKSVEAHVIMPDVFSTLQLDHARLRSNSAAALKDIENYMSPGRRFEVKWDYRENYKSISGPIFDECYLVSSERIGGGKFENVIDVYDVIAENLFIDLDEKNKLRSIKKVFRSNCQDFLNSTLNFDDGKDPGEVSSKHPPLACRYSSYGFSKIDVQSDRVRKACSALLAMDVIMLAKNNVYIPFDRKKTEKDAENFAWSNFIPADFSKRSFSLRDYRSPLVMNSERLKKMLDDPFNKAENLSEQLEKEVGAAVEDFRSKIGQLTSDKILENFHAISEKITDRYRKIIFNNLDMMFRGADEKSENRLLRKKLYELLEPSVDREYGLEKAEYFFTELESELAGYNKSMRGWLDKYGGGEADGEFNDLLAATNRAILDFRNARRYRLEEYEMLLAKYSEYRDQLQRDFSFNAFIGITLRPAGLQAVEALTRNVTILRDTLLEEIAKYENEMINLFTAAALNYFNIELLRRALAEAVSSYYGDYILKMFARDDAHNTEGYFLPFVAGQKISRNLDRLHGSMNDRYAFFSNFRQSSNHIIVRYGSEVKDKDFKTVIRDYYAEVSDEFTGLPENYLTNINKNKFGDYLNSWIKNYMEYKRLNSDFCVPAFFECLSGTVEVDDLEMLFHSLKKHADEVAVSKTEGRFSLFTGNMPESEHILNSSVKKLFELSDACVGVTKKRKGSWQNSIAMPGINHSWCVLVNDKYSGNVNFRKFFDEVKKYSCARDVEDEVIFYSGFHGFPLIYCNALDGEFREYDPAPDGEK